MSNTLVLIGASHSKNLDRHLHIENYQVHRYIFPGYSGKRIMKNIPWGMLETLNEKDVILLQVFGNDSFKPNTHEITYQPKKIIHLKEFQPEDFPKLEKVFLEYRNKLSSLRARVLIINNIPRHFYCCREHRFKGIIGIQSKINKLMLRVFSEPKCKIQVLKWNTVFLAKKDGKSFKASLEQCKAIYDDKVHLKPEFYRLAVQNLKKILSREYPKKESVKNL